LYSFPDIIRQIKLRRMRWAGHVAHMGEERKLYKVWWERPKKPLGRPRHRWEVGISMDLREIVFGGWWIGFGCFMIGTVGALLWVR
jgi:hypothetical protein